MATQRKHSHPEIRRLLADEIGTVSKEATRRIALAYPSPYRAAMSSLGYQTIYRLLNERPDLAADRAILPDDIEAARTSGVLTTYERNRPVGDYPVVAFSVAYELEIAGVIDCLSLAGIPVLAKDRNSSHPVIIAGGPLTFSNPGPLAPFFDIVVLGEADELVVELIDQTFELGCDRHRVIEAFAGKPGYYVPEHDGDRIPAIAAADNACLPARSQIITPNTELRSMFLTEAARGCSRGCTYCVMRRSTNGGMRVVPVDVVLAGIPDHAKRVGLVGAAVTDHPGIRDIVRGVVESGREVGISSLRADKLDDELVALLAQGGYRTLTVAFDGASQRLRDFLERKASEDNLRRSAELARDHKLHTLKLYMMVGVPGETDDDIDELVAFMHELQGIHSRIALGIAPFVAKRNTPLDGEPFGGISEIDARLKRLRRALKGKVTIRPTSARWAWVEYMLAQGDHRAGLACMDAHLAGGTFADYKRAFKEHGCQPSGPVARVLSTAEMIARHRKRIASQAG
jgi:radical SAM superfamily enzyme YgiQ (UPF0313 family)